jgi:hypothetical protein
VFVKKLIIALAVFLAFSLNIAAMQDEKKNDESQEPLIQFIDANTGIVQGAVYYKIHGNPRCERHGWGSNSISFQECSEVALVKHDLYGDEENMTISLHDKNWKLLAYGELPHPGNESIGRYIKRHFLDPNVMPKAVKAVVSEDLIYGRHITFYDGAGVVILSSPYHGAAEPTLEELATFEDRLDLSALASIEVRAVPFLMRVGKCVLS